MCDTCPENMQKAADRFGGGGFLLGCKRIFEKGWQAAARGVVWPLRISGAASCKREGVVLFRGGQEIFLRSFCLVTLGVEGEIRELWERWAREGGRTRERKAAERVSRTRELRGGRGALAAVLGAGDRVAESLESREDFFLEGEAVTGRGRLLQSEGRLGLLFFF